MFVCLPGEQQSGTNTSSTAGGEVSHDSGEEPSAGEQPTIMSSVQFMSFSQYMCKYYDMSDTYMYISNCTLLFRHSCGYCISSNRGLLLIMVSYIERAGIKLLVNKGWVSN